MLNRLIQALALASVTASPALAQRVDHAEHHTFVMSQFTFESGATVPNVKVVYGTYGHLNAAKDNVVLLPSHYMANHHGYEWLIGPGLALDTAKLFLVATELFGNGNSSSPSNTPEPFHGPRFPVATIRDNVEAVHRLLLDSLHVTHLNAIIGFSMGAEQAFQWGVSYPDFADRIVATSGTAKCWPHGVVRLEAEIGAIQLDTAFKGGDYTTRPTRGVELFASIWAGWLFSQEWWHQQLWKNGPADTTSLETYRTTLIANFLNRADPNDLILQARTWEHHDIGATRGFDGNIEKALAAIKAPFLYMPSETDLYFPVSDARYEAKFMPHVTLTPIPSLWGHPAGAGASPADKAFLNEKIAAFLNAPANAR
ncbi:MAG TPA: alpha/beta fold hydrolase [Gemmatimonadales bacterium]|jgi:homoserine O-acetyltransferase